jgi:hypothetical protein
MKKGQKFWIGKGLYTVEVVRGASILATMGGRLFWIIEDDIPWH